MVSSESALRSTTSRSGRPQLVGRDLAPVEAGELLRVRSQEAQHAWVAYAKLEAQRVGCTPSLPPTPLNAVRPSLVSPSVMIEGTERATAGTPNRTPHSINSSGY